MSRSEKAAKSVLIMIIFAFGSKILGFLRELLIAAKFGSGVESDTFFIALTATTMITAILTQAIGTTMIPILSEVESKEGKHGKATHTNNLLNIILLISLFSVALGWILAPVIIRILARGFEGEQFKLAVQLLRIGLPVMIFAGINGILRGYLQSELMFTESAMADFPFNFIYIFFLIFLSSTFGVKGLMVASVLAVATQIMILVPGIRKIGYKYKPTIDFKDRYIKKILTLVPPILLSVGVNDLNKIIDRSLASTLITGSISALNYGNRLKNLILGIFITTITTVIFPMLSKEANKSSYDGLKKVMGYGFNTIVLITIPATVGMIVLAEPIVRIAFERGAFDTTATYMTTGAVVFYSVGIVGMALKPFLNTVYYSLQDTKTPMIVGFFTVGFNITLNLILVRFMAHRGLALATSISSSIATLILMYGLKKKIGSLGISKFVKCGFKALSAALVMGLTSHVIFNYLEKAIGGNTLKDLLALLFSAGLGALIYFIIIYLYKIEEINWIGNLIKKRLQSKNNVTT